MLQGNIIGDRKEKDMLSPKGIIDAKGYLDNSKHTEPNGPNLFRRMTYAQIVKGAVSGNRS